MQSPAFVICPQGLSKRSTRLFICWSLCEHHPFCLMAVQHSYACFACLLSSSLKGSLGLLRVWVQGLVFCMLLLLLSAWPSGAGVRTISFMGQALKIGGHYTFSQIFGQFQFQQVPDHWFQPFFFPMLCTAPASLTRSCWTPFSTLNTCTR